LVTPSGSDPIDWTLTTWEGSRRAQLRRWCALTLRERLVALDEMTDLASRFTEMREQGRFRS
jgi:CRISPR-associated protein Csx17